MGLRKDNFNRGRILIKIRSFDHKGGWYFYRLHNHKISELCNGFSGLKNFLEGVYDKCPNKYFDSGPRSSCLRFKLDADLVRIKGHKVSWLTKEGLEVNDERFKTGHSKVQVYMLENDNETIACEVPIWLKYNELKNYEKYFNCKDVLTGHIDILGVENGNVWVWDYKPGAVREKFASTQVFFYSLMLSKRTGISLDKFRCGYFDENYCFMFKPEMKMLDRKFISDY